MHLLKKFKTRLLELLIIMKNKETEKKVCNKNSNYLKKSKKNKDFEIASIDHDCKVEEHTPILNVDFQMKNEPKNVDYIYNC